MEPAREVARNRAGRHVRADPHARLVATGGDRLVRSRKLPRAAPVRCRGQRIVPTALGRRGARSAAPRREIPAARAPGDAPAAAAAGRPCAARRAPAPDALAGRAGRAGDGRGEPAPPQLSRPLAGHVPRDPDPPGISRRRGPAGRHPRSRPDAHPGARADVPAAHRARPGVDVGGDRRPL
ncbi:hypothetical protein DMB66_05150 [Actinoplanes sp. ATCC 53533]|nr:hypothetical protein DMB66_05150 [Actinoplanes sp. ATCC 53533]